MVKSSAIGVLSFAYVFIALAANAVATGECSFDVDGFGESPRSGSRYSPIAKGPSDDWFVDWDEAQREAKRKKRRLFVWCECKRCCSGVAQSKFFADPIFLAYARENLVLMYFCRPFGDGHLYEPEQAVQYRALSSVFRGSFGLYSVDGKRSVRDCDLFPYMRTSQMFVQRLKTIEGAKEGSPSRSRRILFDEGYSNLVASLSIQCTTNDESWATTPAGARRLESRKLADCYRLGLPDPTWSPTWEQAVANARKSHRNILVVLVGTDWCEPSRTFLNDVLKTKKFKNVAKKLEVVYLDLLRTSDASAHCGKMPRDYVRRVVRMLDLGDVVPRAKLFDSTGKMVLADFQGYVDVGTFIRKINECGVRSGAKGFENARVQ